MAKREEYDIPTVRIGEGYYTSKQLLNFLSIVIEIEKKEGYPEQEREYSFKELEYEGT